MKPGKFERSISTKDEHDLEEAFTTFAAKPSDSKLRLFLTRTNMKEKGDFTR